VGWRHSGPLAKIPIVVVSGDPVGTGLVASLNRPGGNVTGVSQLAPECHGKCVELFRDMLPAARRIAALGNAVDPFSKPFLEQVLLAGKATATEIAPVIMVRGHDEIDAAFATMKKQGADAVVVQGSLATKNSADLALEHRLPAATFTRAFAEVGGLMSYGPFGPELFRRSAVFVSKILQGGKPADIPVEQPTKFELVINLKTAKALGLTIGGNVPLARQHDDRMKRAIMSGSWILRRVPRPQICVPFRGSAEAKRRTAAASRVR